jgi:hypothetical protein
LAFSVVIWCIFPVLDCCTKKNLATLHFVNAKIVLPNPEWSKCQ